MRIGFDFDKVFVDYPPLVPDRLVNYFYRYGFHFRTKKNSRLVYRVPGKFEEKIRLLTHFSFLRPALSENVSILRKVAKDKKNRVFLVSGRFGFLKDKTDELLKRDRLERLFKGIYFNFDNGQPHTFKEKILRKHKISAYVDDDLELLRYLSAKLPFVTFFWITPRNDIVVRRKNIIKIKTLVDFYEWYKKQ